jgi:hypothetical protein
MNRENRAREELTRVRGMGRFVLISGVVGFGSLMFMLRFIMDYFVWHRTWDLEMTITNIVLFLIVGSIFGTLCWLVNKFR